MEKLYRRGRILAILVFSLLNAITIVAQDTEEVAVLEYSEPTDFEIGGITVVGANNSDDNAVIGISGLRIGDKIRIPGADIPRAIKALWKLRLFTDVQILQEKTIGEVIFLEIKVQERPRLSRYSYEGAKKGIHDDLNEEVDKFLLKGGIVTENVKVNAKEAIEEYYIGKGFLDANVLVEEIPDTARLNSVRLLFKVDRGEKIKVSDITFSGNPNAKEKKLRKQMENTKRKKRLFASSKFIKPDFEDDKNSIVAYYNTIGYRDAKVIKDSIWRDEERPPSPTSYNG